MPEANKNYTEIVLTGGPAAGKTTALSYIAQEMGDRGIRTLTVPEVATILISGGVYDLHKLWDEDHPAYWMTQRQIVLLQSKLRKAYREIAESFAPDQVLILYDRAECDAIAYSTPEFLLELLEDNDLTLYDARDSYDTVIHLVTSANGAEGVYSHESNSARQENAAQARAADLRTMQAWAGHPHLKIVDNRDDFDHKLRHVLDIVTHSVGVPTTVEIERWFLLAAPPTEEELSHATKINIEQTYLLTSGNTEARIRKRSQHDHSSYYWTEKIDLDEGIGRIEKEAVIDKREFDRLMAERDPDRGMITKDRYCFISGSTYCELDHFYNLDGEDIWLLEIELLREEEEFDLPDFLDIDREVTGEEEFKSSSIAKRSTQKPA